MVHYRWVSKSYLYIRKEKKRENERNKKWEQIVDTNTYRYAQNREKMREKVKEKKVSNPVRRTPTRCVCGGTL